MRLFFSVLSVAIAPLSVSIAVWEVISKAWHKPTVSDLSHRSPWSYGVALWLALLILHFIDEAREDLTEQYARALRW